LSKPAPQSSRSGAGIRRHFADHADSHADDEAMTKNMTMTKNTKDSIERSRPRHEFADVSVIVTTVTLFVSLVITATAEAISIARADTLVPIADHSGGRLALAVLMALVIASLGGLTAVTAHGGKAPTRRD
jgi:hypothetical protein